MLRSNKIWNGMNKLESTQTGKPNLDIAIFLLISIEHFRNIDTELSLSVHSVFIILAKCSNSEAFTSQNLTS